MNKKQKRQLALIIIAFVILAVAAACEHFTNMPPQAYTATPEREGGALDRQRESFAKREAKASFHRPCEQF